ncbi:MAG: hypothetical protein ABW157_11150 [Candidatus Thiodiazotropha sp. LLP2]
MLEDAESEMTPLTREVIADQAQRLRELDQRIAIYDHRINDSFKRSETCQRLATIAVVIVFPCQFLVSNPGQGHVR